MSRNPFKNQLFTCILALLAMQCARAQDTATGSTITIKPTTDFDQRFYYVPGERQNVWGYRVGALINDNYKLGIGGYYMNQHSDQVVNTTPLTRTASSSTSVQKKLYLGTVYYEPYLMRRDLWETSIVFEAGYGRTVNTTTDKSGNNTAVTQNSILIPAGVGLSVNLKLPALFHIECLRWVGINAIAGYRTTIYQQDKQYDYNGAYWSLSGAIFLDKMVDDYRSWKKKLIADRNKRIIQLSY